MNMLDLWRDCVKSLRETLSNAALGKQLLLLAGAGMSWKGNKLRVLPVG